MEELRNHRIVENNTKEECKECSKGPWCMDCSIGSIQVILEYINKREEYTVNDTD